MTIVVRVLLLFLWRVRQVACDWCQRRAKQSRAVVCAATSDERNEKPRGLGTAGGDGRSVRGTSMSAMRDFVSAVERLIKCIISSRGATPRASILRSGFGNLKT